MKTIWKYPLSASTVQTLQMPADATILTAQVQGDDICLWALVDLEPSAIQARKIEVLCTGGHEPSVPRRHIATVQMHNSALVFHVFERT